ncbi:hypothetical protein [Hymenobacter pini]|nr:hypothetical protein [Hymenobacter pini]
MFLFTASSPNYRPLLAAHGWQVATPGSAFISQLHRAFPFR